MATLMKVCAKCGRNRNVKFYKAARGRVCVTCLRSKRKVTSRSRHLETTFAITQEEYEALLAAQGGACAVCRGVRNYTLDVDHSHAVELALLAQGYDPAQAKRLSIRGLCCKNCNRQLLPAAKDKAELLRAAADYLDAWPAAAILGGSIPDRCRVEYEREYAKVTPTCHPDRRHEAHGLCKPCYQKDHRGQA